jgi:hypothetical protein
MERRMKWNRAPGLVVLTGLILAARSRPAAANAAPACAPAPVVTDAIVRRRWPDLPALIQRTFEQREDVDAYARIDIAITGAAVIVKVTLPNGRTAARSVLRREDVLPALEALLLLPDSGSEAIAAPPAATDAAGTAAKAVRVDRPERIAATVTIIPQPPSAASTDGGTGTHLRIELGLGVEARAGDGQVGAGVAVASFLELAHWLLGFQARIDGYRLLTGDTSMSGGAGSTALELDALVGRRFELGTTTLDLVAGPALAMHGNVSVTAPVGSAPAPLPPPRDEQGLPRLVVSSRLTFRAPATLRTFVQLDAEIGRPHSSSNPMPDQADLPAWTAGLAIGATVGTR